MSEFQGCPGSRSMSFDKGDEQSSDDGTSRPTELRQWPVQLHLVSPEAPYFQGADVLLAADCVAYAAGDFHKDFLKGKGLAIACPKLDDGQEIYVNKLRSMIDDAKINTLTVAIMQVPCCGGLLAMAKHFTNVYVDMCWAWTMSPRASHDFLREYLHAAPIHKLFGFGGDVYYPTGPAAYAIQARRWMSRALSAEIGDGDLTLQQAMDIATRVLRGNQYKLFDIERTRDACRQAALTPSRNSPAG